MASFIAKQLVGKQLDKVKGAVGGGDDKKDDEEATAKDEEAAQALADQRREEEEARREKHRMAEEEREGMRAQIRKKYGIKKREDPFAQQDDGGGFGRKRKTPEELAAEARGETGDEESFLPAGMADMQAKLQEGPRQLLTSAQEKCSLM